MKKKILLLLILILLIPSFVLAKQKEKDYITIYVKRYGTEENFPYMVNSMWEYLQSRRVISISENSSIYIVSNGKILSYYDSNQGKTIYNYDNFTKEDNVKYDFKEDECETKTYNLMTPLECKTLTNSFKGIELSFEDVKKEPDDVLELKYTDLMEFLYTYREETATFEDYLCDKGIIKIEQTENNNCDGTAERILKDKNNKKIVSRRNYRYTYLDYDVFGDVTEDDNIEFEIDDEFRNYYNNLTWGGELSEKYKTAKLTFIEPNQNLNFVVKSIKTVDKSENTNYYDYPNKKDNNIYSNISLLNKDDYIEYEIILKNNTDNNYTIKLENNGNDIIEYKLLYPDGNAINKHSEKKVNLLIMLKNDANIPSPNFTNDNYGYLDALENIKILFNKNEPIFSNPKTYTNRLILVLFIVLIYISMNTKRTKDFTKITLAVLLFAICINIKAIDNNYIMINSNVRISNNLLYNGKDIADDEYVEKSIFLENDKIEYVCYRIFPGCRGNEPYIEYNYNSSSDSFAPVLYNYPSKNDQINVSSTVSVVTRNGERIVEVGECTINNNNYTNEFLNKFTYERQSLNNENIIIQYAQNKICPKFIKYLESIKPSCYDYLKSDV